MRLTLTEFLTLDGVAQGPGSPDEDTSDGFSRGGWFVPYLDEEFIQQAADWLGEADALLFGRRTYVTLRGTGRESRTLMIRSRKR